LDGTWDQVLAALLTRADAAGLVNWEVSVDSTVNRAHQHGTNMPPTRGDLSNYKNRLEEPGDHAIGRSRRGLTTKIHALVDGNKRPLVLLLGPGQGGDAPMFENLLEALKVERDGPGRARTRPGRAMADKAYSSKGIRSCLRVHGIQCVIPEKEDQKASRKRKGSAGGRPVTCDKEAYKRRNESRAQLQHHEAMARTGNQVRQTCPNLPISRRPTSRPHLGHRIERHALAQSQLGMTVGARPEMDRRCLYPTSEQFEGRASVGQPSFPGHEYGEDICCNSTSTGLPRAWPFSRKKT
jgi:transposase